MRTVLFFCLLITIMACSEKEVFRFTVEGDEAGPFCFDLKKLDGSVVNPENPIVLFQEIDGEAAEIPFQIDKENNALCFMHTSGKTQNGGQTYRIGNGVPSQKNDAFVSEHKENGNLHLAVGEKPLLTYRYEMSYPPEGVDSIFKKSGYIHPIITIKGDTLTRIQPPDHYHHYGMWGPWTHTRIDGKFVDFWNLGEGLGTVLFREFNSTASGPVFGSFNAHQEHIDLTAEQNKQIALNEDLLVRVWNQYDPNRYVFDYTTTFSSPLENGILLEAYRYGGGIGMRFTERWKADNCSVLTSEGNDRLSADGTNARWCIVSGEAADGKGTTGILFMGHPENKSHPEPMRVWPVDGNEGRGDMFFEFCPIRHAEWKIEPDREYKLKYRMVVFDGELNAEEAEAYWQLFANPPEVTLSKN